MRFAGFFSQLAITVAGLLPPVLAQQPVKYEPTWESIRNHQVPPWFHDAKLGIFIHWGLYSVPAWAPPTGEFGQVDWSEWYVKNPYAEWYLNTIRIENSPTREHHVKTYGADFDYYDFATIFNRDVQKWDPGQWARLFREIGARYVVLTSKHHDGFTLWPSGVPNPKRPGQRLAASRDLVGELTKAVRAEGLRMGLYYSGGLDWTFVDTPITFRGQSRLTAPQTEEYARYADGHWRELIDRYQPSLMWNDITYPRAGRILDLFAHYLNTVPEGIINNRFGLAWSDFITPEYSRLDRITDQKWETCRGLGYSFGYNRVEGPEHVIASDKLIELFVDIVSKNGNLLLNIGPAADGTISEIQLDRLRALGKWLEVHGEGIFGSRPWVRHGAQTADGVEVRFTRKGDTVYAYFLGRPKQLAIPNVIADSGARVELVGKPGALRWTQKGRDLVVQAPAPSSPYAFALKVTPLPWQMAKE